MGLLSFLSRPSSTRKAKPVKANLSLESLEDRSVPATLVVGTGGNLGLPHFSTLQAALATAAAGDTILVENQGVQAGQYTGNGVTLSADAAKAATSITVNNPAIPYQVGNLVQIVDGGVTTTTVVDAVAAASATTTTLTLHDGLAAAATKATGVVNTTNGTTALDKNNLTIQGDVQPGQTQVAAFNIPSLNAWAGTTGLTTTNVATAVNGASKITINNDTLNAATVDDGSNTNTISNSTLNTLTVTGNVANKTGNGSNTITGNTVNGFTFLTGNTTGNTTGDSLSKNTFRNSVTVTQDDGISFSNNTFTANSADALSITATDKASVTGNTFTITGVNVPTVGADRGIFFTQGAAANKVTGATINSNVFNAPNSTGIAFVVLDGTKVSGISAFGNDLRNTGTGVDITGDGTAVATAAGTIDLGDTTTSGDNVFRTFNKTNSSTNSTRSAIFVHNAGAAGTVNAVGNIFDSGVTPTDVIRDSKNNTAAAGIYGAATGVITITPAETAANAYIAGLYRVFNGTTTDPNALSFWTNAISTNAFNATNGFIRSAVPAGKVVDGLYQSLLGRQADAGGRSFWVSQLTAGGTVESIIVSFVTSTEYFNRNAASTNPNGSYIQSLYQTLLGRAGSASDVNGWISQLSTLGNVGVARFFVTSSEFRTNYAAVLYGSSSVLANPAGAQNILHRTTNPSSAELNGWATSKLDLLSVEAFFASSPEGQGQL
jgi:Domain of unknown function (DUF4214)